MTTKCKKKFYIITLLLNILIFNTASSSEGSINVEAFIWSGSGSFTNPYNWYTDPLLIGGPKEQPQLPIVFGPVPSYVNGSFVGYEGSGSPAYLNENLETKSTLIMYAGYGNEFSIEDSNYTIQSFQIGVTPGSRVNPYLPKPDPFTGDEDLYNSKIILKNSTLNSRGTIGVNKDATGALHVVAGDESSLSTLNGDINIGYFEGSYGELVVDSGASLILNGQIYTRAGDANIVVNGNLQINDKILDDYSGLGTNTIHVGDGGELSINDFANFQLINTLSDSLITIEEGGTLKKKGEYNSVISWDIENNGKIEVAKDSSLYFTRNLNNSGDLLVREKGSLSITGGFEGNGDSEILDGDSGTIILGGGATLTGNASISLNEGTLDLRSLKNPASYNLTLYGSFSTDFENTGDIEGNIYNAADVVFNQKLRARSESATWRNVAGSSLKIVNTSSFNIGPFNSQGNVINDKDASLIVAENAMLHLSWNLENDGTIRIEKGGFISSNGGIQNSGSILVEEGATLFSYSKASNITSTGLIKIDLGASLSGTLVSQNGGELRVNGIIESEEINIYGGLLSGSGVIDSNVNIFGGSVSPGNSPGTLQILGNLTFGDNTELNIEISALEEGFFDQLIISGNLFLGSEVLFNISLLDSFMLMEGDIFELLRINGEVFGDFSSIIWNISSDYTFDFQTYFDSGMLYLEILSDGVLIVPPNTNVPEPRLALTMLLLILAMIFSKTYRKSNSHTFLI
ncbi:hypothetical protein [Alteromonas lipolytica]|uniref:PEP-CTERM protein-sorting domain-containing protein n=1 Tax=Alteromonas lipolytica TaxID=1856405 RepID=A0A1E8FC10_9ALTE|nr:hypothetical protein [Alteromonas lipolytica]OFI33462.1 hypothetical protein BFC17_04170 [Alteromonas lipolytica]GGF59466.1 hypothetical protein GCM10011338_09660 [Alteromonas lipolytica]